MTFQTKGGFPVIADEGGGVAAVQSPAVPPAIPLVVVEGLSWEEREKLYRSLVPFLNALAKSLNKPGIRTQEDRR